MNKDQRKGKEIYKSNKEQSKGKGIQERNKEQRKTIRNRGEQ